MTNSGLPILNIIFSSIIAIVISHHYAKRFRKHDLKIEKYIKLSDELSKLLSNSQNWVELTPLLNGTLFFSSEEVVQEIFKLNRIVTRNKELSLSTGEKQFQLTAEDFKPLILAIRKELGLGSKKLKTEPLTLFLIGEKYRK